MRIIAACQGDSVRVHSFELMKNQQEQHWDNMVLNSTGCVKKLWNSSSSSCIGSLDPMKLHSRFDLKLEVGATPQNNTKMIDWSVGVSVNIYTFSTIAA